MVRKTAKTVSAKTQTRAKITSLPIEDDERHLVNVDAYVSRNREALNESIRRSRKEIAEGRISSKNIDEIIVEGRQRHRSG